MKFAVRFSRLLVLVVGLCPLTFAGQFAPAAKYKITGGGSGCSVVLGDFNGDGAFDIALTTGYPDFGVWVLLGDGDGTFQSAKSAGAIAFGRGLMTGDFNKDGNLDLAVASASSNGSALYILLGNGDGTFQIPVSYPAGPFPETVAVADFNRDGNPDIAVGSPFIYTGGNGSVAILLGKGDGTFQPSVSYVAGMTPNSLAVADFNGDGFPDIVTGTTGNNVAILLGNGDGTFQKARLNPVGANPHYVGVGDFNNDGKVDVITTLEGASAKQNKVVIALGNGDGTLQGPINVPSPPKPQATAIADFNLDGFEDIAIGAPKNPLDGMYFLLGGGIIFTHEGNYATGTLVPTATAVGDLNGDGHPDLVVLDGSDSVKVLLNTGASQ